MERSQNEPIKAATQPPKYYIGRVQHNYVFFTPKIIKFCYPTNPKMLPTLTPPKQHVTVRPLPQKQTPFKKIKLVCREEKKKRSRTNKITLVSRTTERSELRGDDSILSDSKKNSESLSSQIVKSRYLKTEHHYTYAVPSHIKAEPLLPALSCDLFSDCHDAERQQKAETYLSLYRPKQEGKIEQEERSLTDSGKLQHRFTNNRKKIFMDSGEIGLNKSVDVCNRSRSRKSIFAPLERHSFSLERSLSLRKKIFPKTHNLPKKSGVAKKEITVDQCDIPAFISINWQKIQQQKEEESSEGSRVRGGRMAESQVHRI